ncbi:VOC family protein [Candidatus Pelagibacter bacterium]|nr:VOC family protein [Candidatus Pelagibacter bacterium]
MIGFVMVGTNDLDKAIKFYDTMLETINLKRAVTNEKYAGYSSKEKPEYIEFYVTNPTNKKKATYGNGVQISFAVNSKEMVDKFYNLGIKLGGKDEGGPGIRPSGEYYCYLRDLDGNKICAFAKINN